MTTISKIAEKLADFVPPEGEWLSLHASDAALASVVAFVVKELREPSVSLMKGAADTPVMHSWGAGDEYITEDSCVGIFTAAIDAILAEHEAAK